jgi:magnesium-protoporphyrin O-methyltransferase
MYSARRDIMDCCQCQGIERLFGHEVAAKELRHYRKHGAIKTTRVLIDALKAQGVAGMTLLDIGGGIGSVQHEVLGAGASGATMVEGSSAYLAVAREEAERQGYSGSVSYYHGNFVNLASDMSPADIVTLDRVICCYHDMQKLVALSSEKAKRLYGVVYPLDTRWVKVRIFMENLYWRLLGNPYRAFVHATADVDAVVRDNGLQLQFYRRVRNWQVAVYERLS